VIHSSHTLIPTRHHAREKTDCRANGEREGLEAAIQPLDFVASHGFGATDAQKPMSSSVLATKKINPWTDRSLMDNAKRGAVVSQHLHLLKTDRLSDDWRSETRQIVMIAGAWMCSCFELVVDIAHNVSLPHECARISERHLSRWKVMGCRSDVMLQC
jgi:hypothetical protein